MDRPTHPPALLTARRAIGAAVLIASVVWLVRLARDGDLLREGGRALEATTTSPLPAVAALLAYAAAFGLRTTAWRRVQPGLPSGQAWAALHVALLGNHVLPLRLGEPLRVVSAVRRAPEAGGVATTTAAVVALRLADLATLLLLAAVAAPALLLDLAGPAAAVAGILVAVATVAAVRWVRRRPGAVAPDATAWALTGSAWVLEAGVVWAVASACGVAVSPTAAVAVTAVTIAAQTVAVTPGGFGTYETAAAAALVALGADPATAFGVALATHALKTAYALAVGGVALALPAPPIWGRLRLRRRLPERPTAVRVDDAAPVVVMIPAYDEAETVGQVVSRLPRTVAGRRVAVLVIDDGSTDATADRAAAAGAVVVAQPRNLGLGAAVRRGLAEATALSPAAVLYLDADGEYAPEEAERLLTPILSGAADYVVGTRFGGEIRHMLAHRRIGNLVLTRWVRWTTRRRDLTDGQSGYRAFSPAAAAAAEVVHDYNYAQVLTLDLLGKGFVYAEVPITYAFRETGTSFVRLGRYLRKVVPAVYRQLNQPG